jgi:hypothetical protein
MNGQVRSKPIKLRKIGGAAYAIDDQPDIAIRFGYVAQTYGTFL